MVLRCSALSERKKKAKQSNLGVVEGSCTGIRALCVLPRTEGASPSTKPPDRPSKLKMYNVFFSEHLHGLSEEGNKLFERKCPRHFFCFSWLPCLEQVGLIFLNVKPRLQKGCCYCSLSRVRLCDLMGCNTPGFPVHHQLLELAQTHIY